MHSEEEKLYPLNGYIQFKTLDLNCTTCMVSWTIFYGKNLTVIQQTFIKYQNFHGPVYLEHWRYTVKLQRLQPLWNGANECYLLSQVRRHSFSIFFNMKGYCVFWLESPHRGDSNEYTQYTIFNTEKKIILNYPKSEAMGFFQGTQEPW